MQMIVELFLELASRRETVRCRAVAMAAVGPEPATDECFHLVELIEALLHRGAIVEFSDGLRRLAVEEQFRHAALARTRQGVLKLPLGARNRLPRDRPAKPVRRQCDTKP